MLDLSSHRQHKQNYPVNNQHRPEDGDIEDGKPRANKGNGNGASGRVPELELRQTADEWPEFLVLLGREAGGSGVTVLKALILGKRGVEFGSQESEEEIQEINAERVGDDIPALRKENAQEEDEEEHAGTNPAVGCVRGRGIEVGLIVSSQFRGVRGHGCEGRLIGLRDIHDEELENGQSTGLDHRKKERKEEKQRRKQ